MAKNYNVNFTIGAALGGSFGGAVGSAKQQIVGLTATMRKMEKQKLAAENVAKYSAELATLRARQEVAGHGNVDLNRKIADTQRHLREATIEAKRHGVEIGQAASQYKQLGTAMEIAERRMARMQTLEKNRATRSNLRGQMLGVGLAVGAAALPVKQAMDFESKMADVRKVVDFDTPQQFKEMGAAILKMSTQMPMAASGIGDIVAAAGQSGIARNELLGFANAAVKMGVAFDMSGAEAGSTMAAWRAGMRLTQDRAVSLADAVNHLSNNMNATAADISEVIKRNGAAATAAGLHESQVAALGAAMLSSGAAPNRVATAMKNLTNSLTAGEKATKKEAAAMADLGFDAVAMSERMQVDATGAITDVFKALRKLPEAARPGMIKEMFGEESQGVISPLLTNLEELEKAFSMTADATTYAGSAQAEYEERAKTTANNIDLFKNRITRLGITIGNVLLPPLNASMGVIGTVLDVVVSVADQFPILTNVVVGAAVGLVVFKAAALGARYGMTLVSDGIVFGKAVFDFFRPSVMATNYALVRQRAIAIGAALAQKAVWTATKLWTVAQWGLNVAMSANPISLLIIGAAALATAAIVVVNHWDTVKKLFMNFTPLGLIFKGVMAVKQFLDRVNFFEAGARMIGTVVSGIKSVVMSPVTAIGDAFAKVREFLPFSDAKKGPLSDQTRSGQSIMTTLGAGMKSASGSLANDTAGALSGAAGPVAGMRGPGAGGAGVNISTINVNVTVAGSGNAMNDIQAAGSVAADRIRVEIEKFFAGQERLSYA